MDRWAHQLGLFPETPASRAEGRPIIRLRLTDHLRWDHGQRRWITREVVRHVVVLRRSVCHGRMLVRFLNDGKELHVYRERVIPDGPCLAALRAMIWGARGT